jgi:hypothetical protein
VLVVLGLTILVIVLSAILLPPNGTSAMPQDGNGRGGAFSGTRRDQSFRASSGFVEGNCCLLRTGREDCPAVGERERLAGASCRFPLLESVNENFTTLETPMREQAKTEVPKSEAVEQNRTVLTVQVLWGCQAYNTTPEEAAQRVVSDLFEQLSKGGSVTVHVEESDGSKRTLEASAG